MYYDAPWWLPGGHLQTIWAALRSERYIGAAPVFRRERWLTPDGDFVDVDFAPTLVASRTALPPEGAARLRPGKAGSAPGAWLEKEPPRSLASRNSLPPEGAAEMWPPRSPTACGSLPPEGAAAPAVWQSQSRGPLLEGEPLLSLGLVPPVIACAPELLPLPPGEGGGEGIPASAAAPASSPQPSPDASNQPPAIRDYFIYRSQQGALLWIYSERLQGEQTGQGAALRPARTWYLHGFFA